MKNVIISLLLIPVLMVGCAEVDASPLATERNYICSSYLETPVVDGTWQPQNTKGKAITAVTSSGKVIHVHPGKVFRSGIKASTDPLSETEGVSDDHIIQQKQNKYGTFFMVFEFMEPDQKVSGVMSHLEKVYVIGHCQSI